jgi:GTP cyclohydrolase II
MLQAVEVDRIRLLSNNPDKATQLEVYGIAIAEHVPTGVHRTESNAHYLRAKRDHTAHTLDLTA